MGDGGPRDNYGHVFRKLTLICEYSASVSVNVIEGKDTHLPSTS